MPNSALDDKLTIIREGVYGTDVREAIADAIELADTSADERIGAIHDEVQNDDVRMSTTLISGTEEDYLLTIVNPTP